MSGKQGGSEQNMTGPNKDEYLMNLFRREDMGYTNPQPSMFPQASQSTLPSQSGQPGPHVGQSQPFTAFSAVNLPGYPGCGMLSRNGDHIAPPQQQQLQQRRRQQQDPGLPGNSSDKVINRMGQQAYDDLRELVLHHQETFVEQLYDLHRLTRRQQHLEANCGQRAAYNAELQSLGSAVAAAAVKEDKQAREAAAWRAHEQAQQEENAANGSGDPSVERKGSNAPGESSDPAGAGSNRAGTNSHSNEQQAPPGGAGGVAASVLQQQHQNLKAAQANAAAAAVEVQRQQGLLAAAAQAQHFSAEQDSMAAAAQVQAAHHQRNMEAAAESHSQHQQFMAAAAQAHLQHQADMVAAAQARAQHQADIAEAQMAYGGVSGGVVGDGSGGSSGRHGTGEGSRSGPNAGQSAGMAQQDASRNSYMQAQQLQQQPNGTLGSHNGMGSNFQQGFNPMGMSGMMGGYGYGYGNGGNFYQGFGNCYPNMNGYHYNQYGMPAGAMCNFDPMQSWYMHHYGRGAAQATADAAQAAADGAAAAAEAVAEAVADAQAQQKAAAAAEQADADTNANTNANGHDAGSSQQAPPISSANVARWWQDPAQVFGPEVLPEVVARMSSPAHGHGAANGVSMRHRSVSRPGGSKHERPTEDREVPGLRAPPKQRAKKANAGSGVPQRPDEMTGQTSGGSMFGSGGSAFRKIPQRPRSVRSIARTNSIGSENSKSSFGATAAVNQATGDASPPKQMQSAANILVGFSGHTSPQQ
ncbi:hypothetical protein COCOBI_12-1880 [Coccomyxa sp. Obi]|nr:hypothetical protein COCOBI_12-1880 [Coccomyxa sp. Obi]